MTVTKLQWAARVLAACGAPALGVVWAAGPGAVAPAAPDKK